MAYGARQWATKSFGDGLGAPDLAVPPPTPTYLYGPGTFGASSIGVNAYGGPAAVPPGIIPPVEYFVSIAGLLPTTGALGPKSQLAMTAGMALDSAFDLDVRKTFAGAITSAGTLTMRASDIRINGQVNPAGVLRKLLDKVPRTGTITPAGVLHNRVTLLAFTGDLEMTGEAESHSMTLLPTFTAGLAPTGVKVLKVLKVLDASIFPHGSVSLGIQSPGGYAGTIAPMGALTLTYPGGLTALAQVNMSGTVRFEVARSLAGTVTSSSAIHKVSARSSSGAITPHGALTTSGRRSVSISGSLTSSGSYRPQGQKRMTATIGGTGALVRHVDHLLAGSIASAGSRTLQGPDSGSPDSFLVIESTLTMSGRLTHEVTKNLAGTITPRSTTVAIYYEPMVLVPGFVYTKWRRGVLLP